MHPHALRRVLVAISTAAALTLTLSPVAATAATSSRTETSSIASSVTPMKAKGKSFSRAPRPAVSGGSSVGSVLVVDRGAWKPRPSFSYRWKVDGYTVAGATQSRYTVRAKDAGSRITVTVRATKRGYRATERTSASVQIAVPAPAPAPPAPAPAPSAPVPTPAPSSPAPPAPAPAFPIAGDGDYRVGVNVAAGVYVTTGATDTCYWKRVTAFDGAFSSIITNDIGSGQRIIRIKPTDYGVSFSRCGSWVRESDAPAASRIQTGQYLVGSQIQTGFYSATPGSSGCYWALLSDFDGSVSSIIDNDYRSDAGTVYLQIPAGTRGFESSGCGVWTRLS